MAMKRIVHEEQSQRGIRLQSVQDMQSVNFLSNIHQVGMQMAEVRKYTPWGIGVRILCASHGTGLGASYN